MVAIDITSVTFLVRNVVDNFLPLVFYGVIIGYFGYLIGTKGGKWFKNIRKVI